jgi:4-hydroxy-tetrahydrodipicolinate synthase
MVGVAAAAAVLTRAAPALAQSRKLGSREKTMYWVASVTPCNRNGAFDPGAYAAIMQWHKECGADGVMVLGTSGEFPSFSVAERKLILETALKNRNGLNIMMNPGTSNIAETIDLAKHAEANGADGMLVIPPFYFNEPPLEGLTRYFSMLFDAVRIPISLYHIPGASEVSISLELLKSLHHYPHLAGIKDSSGSAEGFAAFMRAFPDLNMRAGTSNNLERALENGMGTILADGNTFSRKCADIFSAYRNKSDWRGAIQKLRTAMQTMRDASGGANTYATMKYVLAQEMGGGDWYPRPPYVPLTDAQKTSLKAALGRVRATG